MSALHASHPSAEALPGCFVAMVVGGSWKALKVTYYHHSNRDIYIYPLIMSSHKHKDTLYSAKNDTPEGDEKKAIQLDPIVGGHLTFERVT